MVLKADRYLFSQMILVAESMKDDVTHPLGPVIWALTNTDGSLRQTNKAALVTELEKMYLLQKLSELYQPASLMGWVYYKG